MIKREATIEIQVPTDGDSLPFKVCEGLQYGTNGQLEPSYGYWDNTVANLFGIDALLSFRTVATVGSKADAQP